VKAANAEVAAEAAAMAIGFLPSITPPSARSNTNDQKVALAWWIR